MHFQGVAHRVTLATFVFVATIFACSHQAVAAVAGGLSLGGGEEYNDNIFFSNEKKHKDESDFITHIVPTVTFNYAPLGAVAPTLTASLSTSGEIYAHNSNLNNFGKNIISNAGYTFRATPRLFFHIADSFHREGGTRTIGLEAFAPPTPLPVTPSQVSPWGAFISLPIYQDVGGLVTKGSNITNYISVNGTYLYAPNLTFSGGYANGYSNTGGEGEVTNTVGLRGIYNWRRDHNLYAGYAATIFSGTSHGKNGGSHDGIVHNIDFGDDYFSGLKIQLDPTWTISVSAGVGVNTTGGGPAVGVNGNVTMIKLWERAVFNLAVRRGFTGSYGISSGPSLTTNVSSNFGIRLTESLTGFVGADYSLFNTEETDFKVFRVATGLQYWFTRWLSSNLWYAYRFRDAGSNASSTNLASSGKVNGNAVVLTASVHFDTFPNFRLARGPLHPLYQQMGAPMYMGSEQQPPGMGPAIPPSTK